MISNKINFLNEPRFWENDNRKNREFAQVTIESLNIRYAALMPVESVFGKRVLDLGACIGAAGYWALESGCTYYVAVEVQKKYCDIAQEIFQSLYPPEKFSILNMSIEEFLDSTLESFDYVIVAGVLYSFIDTYGILKKITNISSDKIVIETSYPRLLREKSESIIELSPYQLMNFAGDNKSFIGLGAIPSPVALNILMRNMQFEFVEEIKPENILHSRDAYREIIQKNMGPFPLRYISVFCKQKDSKTDDYKFKSCTDHILNNSKRKISFGSSTESIYPSDNLKKWSFEDKNVVYNFQKTAFDHIPNYEIVINKCLMIAKKRFQLDAKIVDVGSALGFTLDKFYKEGFRNIVGVESSIQMIDSSLHSTCVYHSSNFPTSLNQVDMVMANWTLHFIEKKEEYLINIYNSLALGGVLIVSDKIVTNDFIHELYYDFKRKNNVTEEEILNKKESLKGIMWSESLEFYLEILKKIGFKSISVIDASFSFNTIYCEK